jgi:hypothetical protein
MLRQSNLKKDAEHIPREFRRLLYAFAYILARNVRRMCTAPKSSFYSCKHSCCKKKQTTVLGTVRYVGQVIIQGNINQVKLVGFTKNVYLLKIGIENGKLYTKKL